MGTNRQTTPQSLTVEYTVTDSLDGVTPAPVVQIDQTRPDATPFDQTAQIYRPPAVERLGLLDPDLLVGGSIGTRCVPFLSLDTTGVGAAGASVDIVGVRGSPSDVFFQKQIEDLAGDAGPIYLDGGFNVPQGSDIRLRGYTAAPGEPIRVRVTILVPDNCLDVAAFHCPCPPNGNGPPPPPPVDAGCLGKFLVAKQPDCAPFTTIGEAYQAAKDAGHGYGQPKGPAQVLVCPGDFDENLLMDRAGIDVIAVAKNPQGFNADTAAFPDPPIPGETRMAGTLTVAFAPVVGPVPRASWQGIDLVPESGVALSFAGPSEQRFKVSDCIIESQDSQGIAYTNVSPLSLLDVRNCAVGSQDVVNLAVEALGNQPSLRFWDTSIAVPFSNPIAMLTDNGAEVVLDNCRFAGQVLCRDTFLIANDVFFLANQATSALNIDLDSFVQAVDCKYGGESGNGGGSFVDGEGFFSHDGLALFGDVDWPVTLFVLPIQGIPQEQHWTFVDLDSVGTFFLSGELNVLVAGPSTPGAVLELPFSVMRPGPIRIIEDALSTAGPVVLSVSSAFPGDAIVVGTDPPAASVTLPSPGAGASGGYMLVSNGAGLWYAMCFCQEGGGGAANCLTQALVSPDPTLAPFQSIQFAYDFLVGLGADETFPAKVLVCPGVYVENVTMAVPGIDIVACAQDPYSELRTQGVGITRLEGTLTVALAGFGDPDLNSAAWRGIDIVPSGGGGTPALIFDDQLPFPVRQWFYISDCLVAGNADDPGLLGINTVFNSMVDAIRVCFENPSQASSSGFEWLTDGAFLFLSDCQIRGQDNNVIGPDAVVRATGTRFLNRTTLGFTGPVPPAANGGVLEATDCTFISGPATIFAGPGPAIGLVDLLRCDTPPDPVVGIGAFIFDYISTSAVVFSPSFDGITTITQNTSIPLGDRVTELLGPGPHVLTGGETNFVVTTPAGVGVVLVVLPPVAARCGPIRIKPSPETLPPVFFGVDVVAPGLETVNTSPVPFPLPAAGATFVSWFRVGGPPPDWETYG